MENKMRKYSSFNQLFAHASFAVFVVALFATDCCDRRISSEHLSYVFLPLAVCYGAVFVGWLTNVDLNARISSAHPGQEINSTLYGSYPYLNYLGFGVGISRPLGDVPEFGKDQSLKNTNSFLFVFNGSFNAQLLGLVMVLVILLPLGLFYEPIIRAFAKLLGEYFGYRLLALLIGTIWFNSLIAVLFRSFTEFRYRSIKGRS